MNIGGYEIPISLDISGWLSSSWIWVAVVCLIGVVACIGVALMLFFYTYKRKIIVFEEISGCLQPVLSTRARVIKLRAGGEEVMKTLIGGYYVSAYGRRIGRNSYWYLKGSDGYLYNFILDKFGKPVYIDGDMRMFHVAIDRLSEKTYGDSHNLTKVMVAGGILLGLIILILGGWWVAHTIGVALEPLTASLNQNAQLTEANVQTSATMYNVINKLGLTPANATSSGITPAG